MTWIEDDDPDTLYVCSQMAGRKVQWRRWSHKIEAGTHNKVEQWMINGEWCPVLTMLGSIRIAGRFVPLKTEDSC